jgi:hypothetical protein
MNGSPECPSLPPRLRLLFLGLIERFVPRRSKKTCEFGRQHADHAVIHQCVWPIHRRDDTTAGDAGLASFSYTIDTIGSRGRAAPTRSFDTSPGSVLKALLHDTRVKRPVRCTAPVRITAAGAARRIVAASRSGNYRIVPAQTGRRPSCVATSAHEIGVAEEAVLQGALVPGLGGARAEHQARKVDLPAMGQRVRGSG